MAKKSDLEPCDAFVKDSKHMEFHIDELKPTFPDLVIDQRARGNTVFLSSGVNSIADHVEFKTSTLSYPVNWHCVYPFKGMETTCPQCLDQDPLIRMKVVALPERIPLFIESNSDDPYLYAMAFEDVLEQYQFSKHVVSKSRLYLLDFMKNRDSGLKKYEEVFIPNSIKKVMVFT
jgi:hypothetical protein